MNIKNYINLSVSVDIMRVNSMYRIYVNGVDLEQARLFDDR